MKKVLWLILNYIFLWIGILGWLLIDLGASALDELCNGFWCLENIMVYHIGLYMVLLSLIYWGSHATIELIILIRTLTKGQQDKE